MKTLPTGWGQELEAESLSTVMFALHQEFHYPILYTNASYLDHFLIRW